jgi:hypothetical protein
MLDRLQTTDNNSMSELRIIINEMEEKVNEVKVNIDYTPTSIKEVEILKVQLDAAEEISEIIDKQNITFITPTTPTTPLFFQRHVPDEFKPLTADEVTILQMEVTQHLQNKTELERQSRLVDIKKVLKYLSNNLLDAENLEEQQYMLNERAKLNVEIQIFRDSFNLDTYEVNGGWIIRNVYTALDSSQRNSILEETANTYAEEPTPVKQKVLEKLTRSEEHTSELQSP